MDQLLNFLTSNLWLGTGIALYLISSLLKVHLVWYIQPKIYRHDINNIFQGYFSELLKSLKSKQLYLGTIRYLFGRKRGDYIVVDEIDNPIKKRMSILDGITKFLSPYLIIGIIWQFLRYWINSRFYYEELQVTLSEIQVLLNSLRSIPELHFVIKYKAYVVFAYGFLCILIPFLYEREKVTNLVKNWFSRSLIYLSVLISISFFGIRTTQIVNTKTDALKDLRQEIIAIHDDIFRSALIYETVDALEENLLEQEATALQETQDFKSQIKPRNPELDDEFEETYNQLKIDLPNKFVSPYLLPSVKVPSYDSEYRTDYFKAIETTFSSGDLKSRPFKYPSDKTQWTKGKGISLKESSEIFYKANTKSSKLRVRLQKALGVLYDFGFNGAMDAIAEDLGLGRNKALKSLVEIISKEPIKEQFTSKVSDVLLNQIPAGSYQEKVKLAKVNYTSDIKSNRAQHFSKFIAEENKLLESTIKNRTNKLKIELPTDREIRSKLGVSGYGDRRIIKALNQELNLNFKENLSLRENIIKHSRKSYFDVFQKTNRVNNTNLNSFSRLLKEQKSNLTLIRGGYNSRFIGSCRLNATICNRCGLPCAFPVCLRMN